MWAAAAWHGCVITATEAEAPIPGLPQPAGPRGAPEPYSLEWVREARASPVPLQFSEESDVGSNILNHVTSYGMNQTIYLTSIMEPKLFREGTSSCLSHLPLPRGRTSTFHFFCVYSPRSPFKSLIKVIFPFPLFVVLISCSTYGSSKLSMGN